MHVLVKHTWNGNSTNAFILFICVQWSVYSLTFWCHPLWLVTFESQHNLVAEDIVFEKVLFLYCGNATHQTRLSTLENHSPAGRSHDDWANISRIPIVYIIQTINYCLLFLIEITHNVRMPFPINKWTNIRNNSHKFTIYLQLRSIKQANYQYKHTIQGQIIENTNFGMRKLSCHTYES